jgi:hypothetical protein
VAHQPGNALTPQHCRRVELPCGLERSDPACGELGQDLVAILFAVQTGDSKVQPLLVGDVLDDGRDPVDAVIGTARTARPDDDRDVRGAAASEQRAEIVFDRSAVVLGVPVPK